MLANLAYHKKTNNLMDLEMILNLKTMNNQLKTHRLKTNLKKPVRLIHWKNLMNPLRPSRPTNRRKRKGRTNQGANLENQMRAVNQPSLEKPRLQREMKFQETNMKV